MKTWIYILFVLLTSLSACYRESPISYEIDDGTSRLPAGNIIPPKILENIEGIYQVEGGQSDFGSEVVIKSSEEHISIFTGKNTAFMVFSTIEKDSVIYLEGYWRQAQFDKYGSVSLAIEKGLGKQLMSNIMPESLALEGFYFVGSSKRNLKLKFVRKIDKSKEFYVIGHRGGSRNIDKFGASENSIEMIKLSERLGCNGIEIDVRETKDGELILFHDNKLSTRLIREDYMTGKISEHSWANLRSFCTLPNGEKIPTLREALDAVLYDTQLEFVWLDIKAFGIMQKIADIQSEYHTKAQALGRKLEIAIGLPDDVIYSEFISLNDYENYSSLCEFSVSKAISGKCKVYAPRWSVGILQEQIDLLEQNKVKIFTWTLDEVDFIKRFVDRDYIEGILSNYPMVIAYERYIKN